MDDGPPRFQQGSTCPAVLRNILAAIVDFVYRAFTFCGRSFQIASTTVPIGNFPASLCRRHIESHDPARTTHTGFNIRTVWADPRSFATTKGVSVDFLSSGYLDVSVPPLTYPDKSGLTTITVAGLPHSGIPG